MKLVIVESPSKAKTINKYLGKDYKVVASYGHIRQLVSKSGSVQPENDFAMVWEETIQAKKNLKEIVTLVKSCDELYLATDPDREGEAISWHLIACLTDKKALKKGLTIRRVVFNSITKDNILEAFNNARDIDDNLVSAYMTRTALDYLVGFSISPILWRKMPGSRSAGRVQSVALKVICERENEIDDFKSEEYWSFLVDLLDNKKQSVKAKLIQIDSQQIEKQPVNNETDALAIKDRISKGEFILTNIENKKLTRNPFAPFTTSTLQQDAFNKLGFSAKKTMQVAQKLYEGINIDKETVGLITYMRTDATQIDPAFLNNMRSYIVSQFSDKYLSTSLRVYKTKAKNAQEAHEAIRPTAIERQPDDLKSFLEDDAFKLYSLIWKRTIASQMSSALYDVCSYDINASNDKINLKATGSILSFDGFYKVYKVDLDEKDKTLPKIELNANLKVENVENKQHFTEAPARYSEATLVKKLEEMGIGRPSTYASIMSVLQERKYVNIDKKRFIPEARGRILSVFLDKFFAKYVEYDFTANLEKQLDEVSSGDANWKKVLGDFWVSFDANIKTVEKITIPEIMETINKAILHHFVQENVKCPKCIEGDVQIKNSKFGAFIGCSNYPECTYTNQLEIIDEQVSMQNNDNQALGLDSSGKEIFVKKGPYGYYVEKTDEQTKRVAIPATIDATKLTLEQAIFFINLPLQLDSDMSFAIGKFGPYIRISKEFYSYKEDIFTITAEKAKQVVQEQKQKKEGKVLGLHDVTKLNIMLKYGRYGVYLYYDGKNIKIPKEYKNKDLSLADAIKIINTEEK